MGTPGNIMAGPATLYVCTSPSATEPFGASGTFAVPIAGQNAFTEVGLLEDGVEFNYSPEVIEVKSDHELVAVTRLLVGEEFSVKANLQEATLRNLQLAMIGNTGDTVGGTVIAEDNSGPPTNPAASQLRMGRKSDFASGPPTLGATPRILAVCFRQRNPSYVGTKTEELGTRVLYMHRCTAVADMTAKFQKGGITMIPVEFKALLFNSSTFGSVELYDVTTGVAFAPVAPEPLST